MQPQTEISCLRSETIEKVPELNSSGMIHFNHPFIRRAKSTQTESDDSSLLKDISTIPGSSSDTSILTIRTGSSATEITTLTQSKSTIPSCNSEQTFLEYSQNVFKSLLNTSEVLLDCLETVNPKVDRKSYTNQAFNSLTNILKKTKKRKVIPTENIEKCPFYEDELGISKIKNIKKKYTIRNPGIQRQIDKTFLRSERKMCFDKVFKQVARSYLDNLKKNGITGP